MPAEPPEMFRPDEDSVAQTLCIIDCIQRKFSACTWENGSCDDASAAHYHEAARRFLSGSSKCDFDAGFRAAGRVQAAGIVLVCPVCAHEASGPCRQANCGMNAK